MTEKASVYKDGLNEICLVLGAPISEVLKVQVNERTIMQQDSYTMEEYPVPVTYREYYLGEELVGKVPENSPTHWTFKGGAPYVNAISQRGLALIGKGQGQVIGLALDGMSFASGVQIATSSLDKATAQLKAALPEYKGEFQLYLFCFVMGE